MSKNWLTVGRSIRCDHIIYDPENRVSREHLALKKIGKHFFIKDLKSLNGTFVDGNRLEPGKEIEITYSSRITISRNYTLDLHEVFPAEDSETTKILAANKGESTVVMNGNSLKLLQEDKTVVFDSNKAQLKDLVRHDDRPFITIGRSRKSDIQCLLDSISSEHAAIRILNPLMFEIKDLNSTNGTWVDGVRLKGQETSVFSTSAKIQLGKSFTFNLKQHFPEVEIIPQSKPAEPAKGEKPKEFNTQEKTTRTPKKESASATKLELEEFEQLEAVWNEYYNRVNSAQSAAMKWTSVGSAAGLALAFTGMGHGGAIIGSTMGRFIGKLRSNKLKPDLNYENVFLTAYACPRCQESFQKKPWVTIRDCFKCKVKYR